MYVRNLTRNSVISVGVHTDIIYAFGCRCSILSYYRKFEIHNDIGLPSKNFLRFNKVLQTPGLPIQTKIGCCKSLH